MLKPSTLEQRSAWTIDALDYLDQGISVFDNELRLVACNKRMLELLELPESLVKTDQHLSEFFRFNAQRGEYGEGNIDTLVAERVALAKDFKPHVFDRIRPDGTIIEVRGNPMEKNGGFVKPIPTSLNSATPRPEQRGNMLTFIHVEGICIEADPPIFWPFSLPPSTRTHSHRLRSTTNTEQEPAAPPAPSSHPPPLIELRNTRRPCSRNGRGPLPRSAPWLLVCTCADAHSPTHRMRE